MKTQKIVHYKISVRTTFMADHPRAGQPTDFVDKIIQAIIANVIQKAVKGNILKYFEDSKITTIRENYALWEKRMQKVKAGKAVIDLYYWEKPGGYYTKDNKQIVFATLDKDSGCGLQRLILKPKCVLSDSIELFSIDQNFYNPLNMAFLAKNDGLTYEDFKAWFKRYDLSKPMAIIHFTPFRY
jgi:hypothetical protein